VCSYAGGRLDQHRIAMQSLASARVQNSALPFQEASCRISHA